MKQYEQQHQRVRNLLIQIHGKEPSPLRSYLTNEEARNVIKRFISPSAINADPPSSFTTLWP